MKIPKKCDFIEICTRSINQSHYEYLCNSQNWINCEIVTPKEVKKYKKQPKEWHRILTVR